MRHIAPGRHKTAELWRVHTLTDDIQCYPIEPHLLPEEEVK